jgi:hypothetical protein
MLISDGWRSGSRSARTAATPGELSSLTIGIRPLVLDVSSTQTLALESVSTTARAAAAPGYQHRRS